MLKTIRVFQINVLPKYKL